MSHDAAAECLCCVDHRPPVLEYNEHHILPTYLGGADVPENLVWLCPTTHANTHELLRHMMRSGAMSYRQAQNLQPRPVSRYAFDLALEGFRRWEASR